MKKFYSMMRRFCAVIIGFVFFGAGVLKLMDPVGTGLIVKEYYNFLHIGFMGFSAKAAGEALALLETFCGIALVTGVFRKVTAWITSILIGGFTVLTLFLWIFNPAMDCGCFGEAFHLTHAQSFLKNVILCALAFFAFFPYRHFGEPKRIKYVTFGLVGGAVVCFAAYSLFFIPMVDFTPFNSSSKLHAAAEDAQQSGDERYVSTFIYEKNGKTGVFSLNNIPDSTWTFVETRTIEKQDNINETDFPILSFQDIYGEYQDSLAADGLVMAVSVYNPGKISASQWERITAFINETSDSGLKPLLLISSSPQTIEEDIHADTLPLEVRTQILISAYYSDYKTLISLNRSNGGATYFDDGNLIRKWASADLPAGKDMKRLAKKDTTEVMLSAYTKGRLTFQAFLLYTVGLMLLI